MKIKANISFGWIIIGSVRKTEATLCIWVILGLKQTSLCDGELEGGTQRPGKCC